MPYKDFSELVLHKVRERDFEIAIVDRGDQVTFAAIHGGPIEPLTACLAETAAGDRHNVYVFAAVEPTDSASLRVPLARFNELRLKNLMERSRTTVHIDGRPDDVPTIGVGTPDEDLQEAMRTSLQEAGFESRNLWRPADVYGGHHFFSHGRNANVQVELSTGLRRTLITLDDDYARDPRLNDRGRALAEALAAGARTYLTQRDMDLTRTMTRFDETTKQVKKVIFGDGGEGHHHH